jgi:hypothetical protein
MTAYKKFCALRDERRAGEEAPKYTEEHAFEMAARAAQLRYPDTLTEDLKEVLGMPNFQCAPIAHVFRNAGLADIPRKAEAEQAFIIDKLIRFVLAHGTDWRKHAVAELTQARDALVKQTAGEA